MILLRIREEFELIILFVFGDMNLELFFRARVVRLNLFFFGFNDEFLNDLIFNDDVSKYW